MPVAFSIRGPLQGELIDFLKSSGFDSNNVTELVRDPRDRTVLDKLSSESGPVANWCEVAAQHLKGASPAKDKLVSELIEASVKIAPPLAIMQKAAQLRSKLGA